MKNIARVLAVSAIFGSLVLQRAGAQTIYSFANAQTGSAANVQIQWASNPLDQYDVLATSNLVAGMLEKMAYATSNEWKCPMSEARCNAAGRGKEVFFQSLIRCGYQQRKSPKDA